MMMLMNFGSNFIQLKFHSRCMIMQRWPELTDTEQIKIYQTGKY